MLSNFGVWWEIVGECRAVAMRFYEVAIPSQRPKIPQGVARKVIFDSAGDFWQENPKSAEPSSCQSMAWHSFNESVANFIALH